MPRSGKLLLIVALALEGLLLLQPDGALVHAAGRGGSSARNQAAFWWSKSPVHMGCSIAACTRPAVRTATYRQITSRGVTWRAYGFCEFHQPPGEADHLQYRLGRPRSYGYDVPLAPAWAEVYFLLGVLGFGVWCNLMWHYAAGPSSAARRAVLLASHAAVLAILWNF